MKNQPDSVKKEMAKPKKPKKHKVEEVSEKSLTTDELMELRKTVSEVKVEEKEIICLIHKGPISGANIYLCPSCKTYYCLNCAKALRSRGEKCWACDNQLYVKVPDKNILASAREKMENEELTTAERKRYEQLELRIQRAVRALRKENIKDALKQYEDAVVIALRTGNAELVKDISEKYIEIMNQQQEIEKAKDFIKKKGKEGIKELTELQHLLEAYVEKAELALEGGRFEMAVKAYAKAAEIAIRIGDKKRIEEFTTLFERLENQENYKKLDTHLREAEEYIEEQNFKEVARSYAKAAEAALKLNKKKKVLEYSLLAEEFSKLARKIGQ